MNGAILGRGADLIVVDDPIKAADALSQAERRRVNETFDNTLLHPAQRQAHRRDRDHHAASARG